MSPLKTVLLFQAAPGQSTWPRTCMLASSSWLDHASSPFHWPIFRNKDLGTHQK